MPDRTRRSSPDERLATLALILIEGVGAGTLRRHVERFGSAARAIDEVLPPPERDAALAHATATLSHATANGITITLEADADYPVALRDLADPPAVLWWMGDRAVLHAPIVSIVGTRRATAYGERVTRELARSLAAAGACVVSGMARGIDGIAHRAALDAGGRTLAVLGTGVDIAYPASHRALHAEIARKGCLLSELPPGDKANGGSFPRRNRLIAALATVTIVVEAPVTSGALITANDALTLGRTVAAVPGPIDQPQSVGTNRLIRDGAQIVTDVDDALLLLGLARPGAKRLAPDDPAERAVWEALGDGSLTIDDLCARSRLPAADCLAALTRLELRGDVDCALTGLVSRR